MFDTKSINIKRIVSVLHTNREGRAIKSLQFNGTLRSYEIILTVSGENYTNFGDRTIHNVPGTVEYLPKGIPNTSYTVDIEENGESIDIIFDTDTPLPREAMSINISKNESIRKLFGKISTLWISGSDNEYCSYRCLAVFYEILAELYQIRTHSGSLESLKVQIDPAIEYMTQHFHEHDLECSYLGEICDMSYSYFRRIFTSVYKMPPIKYLTRIRMNYACELLRNGSYPISEVAAMSGYDNIYYFSRVFRKETGLSPSDYKSAQVSVDAE